MTLTVANLAEALQAIFTTVADQAAEDSRLIRRRRQLTGAALVQGLVFTWLAQPQATYEDLQGGVNAAGSRLGVSALEERLSQPEAADCFKRVLEHAAGRLFQADGAGVPALDAFSEVYLEDSSVVALPAELAPVWPGCGGSTDHSCPASVKLFVRFALRGGALARLELHPGRTCDQTSPLQSAPLPEGSLRVADLGFFNLDVMRRQDREGVYFLSKVQPGTLLSGPEGDFADLLCHLDRHGGRDLDKPIRLGKHHQIQARLLAVRLPRRIVRLRRKRVRAEARRKGRTPSAQLLRLCRWLVLVTNAPLAKLALLQAMALYRARWQIELLFKLWKGHGEIDQSRSGKPARVLAEVYAKLLGMLVQHWVLLLGIWKYADRSLAKAAKRLRARVVGVLDEMGTRAGLRKVLRRIVSSLGHGCRIQRRSKQPSTFQFLLHPSLLDDTLR